MVTKEQFLAAKKIVDEYEKEEYEENMRLAEQALEEPYEYDEEDEAHDCPKCGRTYDDIDYDYQSCSKCGWDEDKKKWGEKREPTEADYLCGDADILTGRWI